MKSSKVETDARYKYGKHQMNLGVALKRNKKDNSVLVRPYVIARYLLEVFLEKRGRILAKDTEDLGLTKPNKFTLWRHELEDLGFLSYEKILDRFVYKPGPKLLKSINEITTSRYQIATVAHLDESDDKNLREIKDVNQRVLDLEKRLDKIETKMTDVIERYDPPVTSSKLRNFLDGEYDPFAGNTERHLEIVRDDSKKLTPF